MNLHRASQAAEWAVVAAVIGLHAFIHVQSQEQPAAWWLQAAADAQPLALMALVAAFAVLGPGWHWARIAAAGALASVVISAVHPAHVRTPLSICTFFASAAMMLGARLGGLRLFADRQDLAVGKLQFSIRSLLAATTAVALLIGSLQVLRPVIASPESELGDLRVWLIGFEREATYGRVELVRAIVPTPVTLRHVVLATAVAGAAIGAVATVLRPGVIWLRLVVLAIAIPSVAAYLTHLAGGGNTLGVTAAELSLGFAAVAALVAISVLPLRLMGYRLSKAATCGRAESIAATSGRAVQGTARTCDLSDPASASVGVSRDGIPVP